MTEVESRNAIFIEKDFPSRGSLYSKTLREYEEEGDTQLTALSGRIEPFSLDGSGDHNPTQESEPVETPFSEKPKGFPVEEAVLNPQFVDIEEDHRSVRDTLSDPAKENWQKAK